MSPIRTAGVVIIENRRALLVRHGDAADHINGTYGIAAGRVREGENELQAAIRELSEETTLEVDEKDLMPFTELYQATIERKDGAKLFTLQPYLATAYRGTPRETAEGVPEWIDLDEIDRYILLPNMKRILLEGERMLREGNETKISLR